MLRSHLSTLRARLILLVTVAVIPVIAAILYSGFHQRQQAIADVEREALALAERTAGEKERLIVETRQLLRLLARVPEVRAGGDGCDSFLAEVIASGEQYANLGVIEPGGLLVCSALPFTAPLDLSQRPYFQGAQATRDFSIGQYQIGLVTRIASVNFAYPILDPTGQGHGVVFAALPLTWLQQRLTEAELPPGSEVLVVDGAATVLARFPESDGWIGRSLAGTQIAAAILEGEDGGIVEVPGLEGVHRLYATTRLLDLGDEQPVLMSVGIPTAVAYAPVNRAVSRNLALLVLALVLVLGLTWWSSDRLVLKPVGALLLATQRLRNGDLSTRATTVGAPREIEALARSFNDMAASLQQHVQEIEHQLVHIHRLGRVRAVLSGINSAILRIRDRDELVREACRISVEEGGFALAWVAESDPESGAIRVAAHAGRAGGDSGEAVPEALRTSGGMVAIALREGREVISNDLATQSGPQEGEDPVAELGFRSAAALPLRVDDRVVASLSLHTTEADFFTEDEVRLMRDLTADTSLGLEYLEKEKQLQYLANYDPLTDLPNRSLFMDRLRQAIGHAREEGRLAAVLLVGIDRLAAINASLGHQAGDRALQAVADHLREAVSDAETAARLGNDQFGVVLSGAANVREVERFATDLLEGLPRQLSGGEETIFVSARIGIAVSPHDGDNPDLLAKAAALALANAASQPAQPIAFHSAELETEARQRRTLEQELRSALSRDELAVFYQPVVDLASGDTIGMEALVRWFHPELGEVSPGVFIPRAEEMGIVREIGMWVLASAAREGRRLQEDGLTELRMNVNVSVSQIRDPLFVEDVTRTIQDAGIDLARLGIGIEITESELMENIEDAFAALEKFREMGMWIYIDDFGTGYSSLSYLRRLPINCLKIDRSFIQDIPADPDAVAVVKSITALARSLDLQVIAEGIETEDQLSTLRELGCHAGQGFLFSRPLAAEELETFLTGTA